MKYKVKIICRDKEAFINQREEDKQKFDEALLDRKKNCILPGGLFAKVRSLFCVDTHMIFKKFEGPRVCNIPRRKQ